MHVGVFHVASIRLLIGFRAEASERHLVQVNAERGHSVQEHVDPEIVLKVFDQVGPVDVLLHDIALFFA